MQFRNEFHKKRKSEELKLKFPSEIISKTLCQRNEGERYYKKVCLDRAYGKCGVRTDLFMKEELDLSETAPEMQWERYEYQTLKTKGNATKRKLDLVKKRTKFGELLNVFNLCWKIFQATSSGPSGRPNRRSILLIIYLRGITIFRKTTDALKRMKSRVVTFKRNKYLFTLQYCIVMLCSRLMG